MLLGSDFSWESWGLKVSPNAHKSSPKSQRVFCFSDVCVKKKSCSERMYRKPKVVFCDTEVRLIYRVSLGFWRLGSEEFCANNYTLCMTGLYCGTGCFQVTWGETNYFHQHSALFWLNTWFRHFFFKITFCWISVIIILVIIWLDNFRKHLKCLCF